MWLPRIDLVSVSVIIKHNRNIFRRSSTKLATTTTITAGKKVFGKFYIEGNTAGRLGTEVDIILWTRHMPTETIIQKLQVIGFRDTLYFCFYAF